MTYNPAIPQASDIIADSQSQILTNFAQLNVKYGTSGDHYAWDNNTAVETNAHAKVTLPGIAGTRAPPGDVTPAPAATVGAIFSRTINGETFPRWIRDNLATEYPLLPIKAYGMFVTTATTGSFPEVVPYVFSFGCSASVSKTAVGKYVITFANAFPSTDYGVFAFPQVSANPINLFASAFDFKATDMTLEIKNNSGTTNNTAGLRIPFAVLY